MTWTKGKYVDHDFTPDQEKARKSWRGAQNRRMSLLAALQINDYTKNRALMHKRLDTILDRVEKREKDALVLFPDVAKSFILASMTVKM